MGTPSFAAKALVALIEAKYDIAAVYSQPPKPADRGLSLRKSPVHLLAEHHNLPIFTPVSLRDPEIQDVFAAHKADIAIVAAYGLILPRPVLEAPRFGCLNIHASLLPRWRGAAPIQRAILAGDAQTGISIMQMDPGLDTGPVLLQRTLPIGSRMNSLELHDALALLGGKALLEALGQYSDLHPQAQSEEQALYAAKLTKEEGKLDWRERADFLDRKIRAFTPWPGAYGFLPNQESFKIHQALLRDDNLGQAPGTLLDDALTIACGQGALQLLQVQRAGKKPLSSGEFLRGFPLAKGTRLP